MDFPQSTVTLHIQQLESELGPLFARHGKKVTLTEAGRLLSQHSSPILDQVTSLRQVMAVPPRTRSLEVLVGALRQGLSDRA